MKADRRLFAAFIAGFQASGEGYNGEYPEMQQGQLRLALLEDFEEWLGRKLEDDGRS